MSPKRVEAFTVLAIAVCGLLLHLLPFFFYSSNPLGYDTGFYRRYLIEPAASFPNTPVPGLGTNALMPRLVLDTLRTLHLSPEICLYGSYLFFWILLPILFFYWLKPHTGVRGATIAAFLLVFSPVAYTSYWFILYKNALALCLVLAAFIFFERKLFWPLIILDVLIPLTHETTSIIYLSTLFLLLFLSRDRWKEICLHGTISALAFLSVNISAPKEVLSSGAVAVFLEWRDYITLSFSFILGALLALPVWRTVAKHKTLVAFGVVSIAFPVLHLPFYERIFVFTDVALIACAAYGIQFAWGHVQFTETSRWQPYFFFCALLAIAGLTFGNLESEVNVLRPLMSDADLGRIQVIGTQVPDNALLLTSSSEAPWYEGWTSAHIAAPGMLHDTHNLAAWTTFWNATSSESRVAFLATFPHPLYISTLGGFDTFLGALPPCVETVAPDLLKDTCKN